MNVLPLWEFMFFTESREKRIKSLQSSVKCDRNACNFGAIKFVNDFENAVFDRNKLVMHLDKEVYKGGSLPNLIEGGAPLEIGKFNTKTK